MKVRSQIQIFLEQVEPPQEATNALKALWYEKKGEWDAAHDLVQDGSTSEECQVHAYLHRKEGDIGNAGYWYRSAGTKLFEGSLDQEWESLVRRFLEEG